MGIKIIGAGHVFQKSVDDVKKAIEGGIPDVVALELDGGRFNALLDRFHGKREKFKVRGGSFPLFVNLLVGKILERIQIELGRRFGGFPGREMVQAIESAKKVGSEIALIDRSIEITLNRLISTPLGEKYNLLKLRKVDIDIFQSGEILLKEEVIEKLMNELKINAPRMYSVLVDERDKIMALSLDKIQSDRPDANILAIVGAGHKKGVLYYLNSIQIGKKIYVKDAMEIKSINTLQVFTFLLILVFAFILMQVEFFIRRK